MTLFLVSIHVPARGTTFFGGQRAGRELWFQSTFPQGERPSLDNAGVALRWFQSTFPQGERLRDNNICPLVIPVSIHVPARGTTVCLALAVRRLRVSIHVPARGTTYEVGEGQQTLLVSIHVPARGTTDIFHQFEIARDVSIHVPARGTTKIIADLNENLQVSIHVPARGTTAATVNLIDRIMFQSTFPQGERRRFDGRPAIIKGFNPRSRKGNDYDTVYVSGKKIGFNPRSRKGNDMHVRDQSDKTVVSIHVPARGTTVSSSSFAPMK